MSRFSSTRPAALVISLALAIWGSAAWAEQVTVRAGAHQGFGRIVFDWPHRVTHRSEGGDAVLTIRFGRDIEARYEEAIRRLSDYLVGAHPTEDGRGIRLALKRPVQTSSFRSGNAIVYDLMHAPAKAEARPRSQAKARIEPGTRARAAPEATATETIRVRVGEHADFERLVFDWPRLVDYRLSQRGTRIEARFASPARIAGGALARSGLPLVRDFNSEIAGGETVVVIELTRPAAAKHFRVEGQRIVVDLPRRDPASPLAAVAARPAARPKVETRPARPANAAEPAPPARPAADEKPTPAPAKARPPARTETAGAETSTPDRPVATKAGASPSTSTGATPAEDSRLAALYEQRDRIIEELGEDHVQVSVLTAERRRKPKTPTRASGEPLALHPPPRVVRHRGRHRESHEGSHRG